MKREIYIAVKKSEAAPTLDYAVGKFGCFLDMYLQNRKPRQLNAIYVLNNYLTSPQTIF